jgi:hydroxymethylbilane synthase
MLPAPAQGALAVECRSGDHSLVEQLGCVNDEYTRAAVNAERSLLATLEAGCSAPVAAHALVDTSDGVPGIRLWAGVFAVDGSRAVRRTETGALSDAVGLGRRMAARLLADGADRLLGDNA